MNASNLRLITPTICYITQTCSILLYGYSTTYLNLSLYRRMNYTDAIQYLKDNNITKDDGTFYEFGEVSYDS